MRHRGLANTWSHEVKVWLFVSVRTVDHPMVIPPVSKNVTARWYIYDSWLTQTFIAGSVGSEDQRGWREAKWNCPKLPALLSQNSKSQIILLPRGMAEIREGKNSECSIAEILWAYLVHVGTGHCLPFCFHGSQKEKTVSNNKFIKASMTIFQLEKNSTQKLFKWNFTYISISKGILKYFN